MVTDLYVSETASGPVCLPNWRYLLAEEAATMGRVLLPSDADESTREFARYLRRERECVNEASRRRLRRQNPGFAEAVDVYRDPLRRTATPLEALVLARESTKSIAERCGVSQPAVEWYRFGFFSVGKWLNNAGYIMDFAIRPELRRGGEQARRRFTMKTLAYFCGSKVLNEFFRSGYVSLRRQWRTPAKFIEGVAASVDLQRAVALAEMPNLAGNDPSRIRMWLEDVVKSVSSVGLDVWPESIIEKKTREML